MTTIVYDHDPSGVSPANRVRDETHVLTELNDRVYRVIVPKFSPFFDTGLVVKFVENNGTVRTLEKGVDYNVAYRYQAASMSTGKMIYGAISVKTTLVNGTLTVGYQTLGGEWVADQAYVLEQLTEAIYNPRIVYWDQLTNVQQTYPPSEHSHPMDDVTSYQDLIDAVNALGQKLLDKGSESGGFKALLDTHEADNHAHGLLDYASDDEVRMRELEDKLVTLRQIINYLVPVEGEVENHGTRLDAIEASVANIEANLTRYDTHVADTELHTATKEKVGLSLVENLPLATQQEIEEQIPSDKYITLAQALELMDGILHPPRPDVGDRDPTQVEDWIVPDAQSLYMGNRYPLTAIQMYLRTCCK